MSSTDGGPTGLVRLGTIAATAVLVLTACGSSGGGGGNPTAAQPPTATTKPITTVGAGEGQLNLVLWDGYADKSWVNPFQTATGCHVNQHPAGSSDEMVSLMKNGGNGQWDLVSASGDADLRLIYGGDVKPMNTSLIPDWTNFQKYFQSPPYNTISGVHYGISLQWGPNTLLYNTDKFPIAPTSWSVLYDSSYSKLITVPNNPFQIADAALYLSKTQTSLGIKDPYELTKKQFDASVALLTTQRPLIKSYWSLASDEITLFQNKDVVVGAAWPYQTIQLKAAGAHVAETIPSQEGATGWADTWMLATNAPHPNCAYKWVQWVSTPLVQAEQALSFGETPVNSLACAQMETLQAGSCAQYHANEPGSYFDTIKFWKTPLATCDDGSNNCIPYAMWQQAWTAITA